MAGRAILFPLAGLAVVTLLAFSERGGFAGDGPTYAAGALLGGLAGFALYHAAFGFTGAWRKLVRERRGAGLRAQVVLIGLVCLVTYPLIGFEAQTGWDMHPTILPMSFASAVGALAFGFGMQLAGGCASGTLFTAGGGSTRMVVVLATFIAGSVWATAHLQEFWFPLGPSLGWPTLPNTSVITLWGPLGGLAALAALLAGLWTASVWVERRAHGTLDQPRRQGPLLSGPWSPWTGAVALAGVCIGCFLLFERPWGVTAGFALWGAQILDAVGVDVRSWGYWSGWRRAQLDESVFANRTSVMNFGIIFGALAASLLAGRFRPVWRISAHDLATAVIGGLLMGYGARLAFGCNIGALLGGLTSGSLHGVWWLFWGFAGSYLGSRMRAVLAMDPPWPDRRAPA